MNRKKSAALLLAAVMIAAMLMTGQENAYALRYESFLDADAMFTERDMLQNPDVSDAVPIDVTDGAQIALTEEGTYLLGGTASDALIIVDAPEDAKVQLVLDGLTLTNSSLPCIYVKSADKVFLTVQGENTLRVNGELVSDGSARIDGAVFSRSDLVLNGTGTLNVSSTAHGIVSKDDLKITGGNFYISAASHGIEANDSIRIAGGNIALAVGRDGLHAENDEDNSLGYLFISGGTLIVNAADDGLHAKSALEIDGGDFTINAAEGLESTRIQLNGGTISIQSWDDGINAAYKTGNERPLLEINGGEITITMAAGDTDGVDSNGDLRINGGTISVTGSSTFDVDGSIEFNGGTVFVNGQQVSSIPNQMMGGRGGFGGGWGSFGEQGNSGWGGFGRGGWHGW